MSDKTQPIVCGVLIVVLCASTLSSAVAQEPGRAPAALSPGSMPSWIVAESASPFGDVKLDDERMAKAVMPVVTGPVAPTDEADFDKYYYFHRADTPVPTAYADITECDGYARGLVTGYRYQNAPFPYTYTMAGAIGGAVGNVLVAAIFGSAEKRRMRRVNMRACMSFKGYQRFGVPKPLWGKFNFEEGLDGVSEEVRQTLLLQQALVAAKSNPAGKVLEP